MSLPVPTNKTPLTADLLVQVGFQFEQLPVGQQWAMRVPPHPQLAAQPGLMSVIALVERLLNDGRPVWVMELQLESSGQLLGRVPVLSKGLLTFGDLLESLKGLGITMCVSPAGPGQAKIAPNYPPQAAENANEKRQKWFYRQASERPNQQN